MEVSVSFSDICGFIRRSLWKLLVVVLVVAAIGGGMSLRTLAPTYSSDSSIMLSCTVPENADKDYRLQYTQILGSRVNSALAILNAKQMKQDIADRLGISADQVRDVKAVQNQNAPCVKITTSTTNALLCAKISDTACEILTERLDQLFPSPKLSTVVVDPGKKAVPVSNKIAAARGAVLGGAFGVVLCFLFAVLKVVLDKHVRNSKCLEETFDIPFLGAVSRSKKGSSAEEYRRIRSAVLLQAGVGSSLLLVPVTSDSCELELAAGLAKSLVGSQRRVLLIDTEAAAPALYQQVGAQPKTSLYDVLAGNTPLEQAAVTTGTEGLSFLGCAAAPAETAADLLGSSAFSKLLEDAKKAYDVVLVNAPAETEFANADTAAAACDKVVAVVRYGATPVSNLRDTLERLHTSGGKMAGFVMTDMN